MEKRIKMITRQNLIATAKAKLFEEIQLSDINDTNIFSLETDYLFYDIDGNTKTLSVEKLLQNPTYNNKNMMSEAVENISTETRLKITLGASHQLLGTVHSVITANSRNLSERIANLEQAATEWSQLVQELQKTVEITFD
jgi:hypothetical protein